MSRVHALLDAHRLRKTHIREQVLGLFIDQSKALSKQDIERQLGEVDRITLYRTLKSFEENGIIHQAIDGTDVSKYALCPSHCGPDHHQHHHAHFHCRNCQDTFCIDEVDLALTPNIQGHQVDQVEVIVQGVCAECRA